MEREKEHHNSSSYRRDGKYVSFSSPSLPPPPGHPFPPTDHHKTHTHSHLHRHMLLVDNATLWAWDEDEADHQQPPPVPRQGRFRPHGWALIDDGRGLFVAVGVDGQEEAKAAAKAQATRVVNAHGHHVIPGLMDAHIHLGYMGEAREYLRLDDCGSLAELRTALAAYGAAHPAKNWIVGVGWDQSYWGTYPTRHDLDQALPGGPPVVLYRACWHIVVANTAALVRAGISLEPSAQFPSFPGMDVDAAGRPTGVFRETAVTRVTDHIAETDEAVRKAYFRNALGRCVRAGLTAVQTNDANAWAIYQELAAKSELPLRVFLTLNHEEMVANDRRPVPASVASPLLSCPRIKLYADGSLGAETAALRQPYVGTANRGVLIHPPEALTAKIRSAHEAGFQLEVHAIGDWALATVLDALETAGVPPEARPVITHCQVMGVDLIARMARMGVVANIQPSFVGTDSKWVQQRILPEVQATSYCWKTLLERGVYCAGGSDAPVEDCSPLGGMYDAMARLPHACKKGGLEATPFLPHECLSFSEALWLYTVGAAYACRSELRLGRLKAGFLADFVIVDRDLSVPVAESKAALLEAVVRQVWVHGVCRMDKTKEDADDKDGPPPPPTPLGGPFISGKNGPRGQQHELFVLRGKRWGMNCCGH